MPLALELAAARAKLLTPEQILERLRSDSISSRAAATPTRASRRCARRSSGPTTCFGRRAELFARLAVFAGGCTLEAAEEVAGADLDTLQSLVDKSLVRRTDDRFWMLETIRDYAAQQLEVLGEVSALRLRHAEYYLGLASRIDEELRGPAQDAWMERVGQQHANFAAAMTLLVPGCGRIGTSDGSGARPVLGTRGSCRRGANADRAGASPRRGRSAAGAGKRALGRRPPRLHAGRLRA